MGVSTVIKNIRTLPVFERMSWKVFAGTALGVLLLLVFFLFFRDIVNSDGTLSLTVPHAHTHILLDNTQKIATTDKDNETITTSLPSGMHVVTALREGYWPWVYVQHIDAHETYTADIFMAPKNITPGVVAPESSRYQEIRKSLTHTPLPTNDTPLYSHDRSTSLWVEGTTIYMEWMKEDTPPAFFCPSKECSESRSITKRDVPPQSVNFYPHRNDVIIFSEDDTIYAVGGYGYNFQPFLKAPNGETVSFILTDENNLNVLIGEDIYTIHL